MTTSPQESGSPDETPDDRLATEVPSPDVPADSDVDPDSVPADGDVDPIAGPEAAPQDPNDAPIDQSPGEAMPIKEAINEGN